MLGEILSLVSWMFQIYTWVIIGYVLMSWIPNLRESSFGQLIARLAEPYLELFRRFIPPLGMIDLSPIIAIFSLYLAQMGLYTVVGFFI